MLDLEDFSCTFIWCVHQNFSPLLLRENQHAGFSVDRSNSWFSRTMSSDGTPHSAPMPFIHAPFTWAYHFAWGRGQ